MDFFIKQIEISKPVWYNPSLPLKMKKRSPNKALKPLQMGVFAVFIMKKYFENMYLRLCTYMKIVIPVFIAFSSALRYNFAGISILNAFKINDKSESSVSIKR